MFKWVDLNRFYLTECTGDTNQLVVIRENNTTGVILRTQQDGITNLNSMVQNNSNACPNGVFVIYTIV